MERREARLRTYTQGAVFIPDKGTDIRVWAPAVERVDLVIESGAHQGKRFPLQAEADGYFALLAEHLQPGDRYRLKLDDDQSFPDPASFYQPEGPHGPSQVVDHSRFVWSDEGWKGCGPHEAVIYEMHVGTFTPEGTWNAAKARLEHLRDLGVTAIELMPVAEFPGAFGWSYDGADLFAPYHGYGTPDDMRAFVDRAHQLGLGVLLDVVYNHGGPDGFYLNVYSSHYAGPQTEWGPGFNFDGEHSGPVRSYFTDNVCYWIREFHVDGLRIDAAPMLQDSSEEHILAALVRTARKAAEPRQALIIVENEAQLAHMIRPREQGGAGADLSWNDDFHHSALVMLTGRSEAYFKDYRGQAHELVAALKYGFLFQGQHYTWQKKPRGTSTRGLGAHQFVVYLENHDQVANSRTGARLWQRVSPAAHRAMTALMLLGPSTPHLLQGQEWNASTPFVYFADLPAGLASVVSHGRADFLGQFQSMATPAVQEQLPDPGARESFERCILKWNEIDAPAHASALALHKDLLGLRRTDPVLGAVYRQQADFDCGIINEDCLLIRFYGAHEAAEEERLLIVNLGPDVAVAAMPQPLLAPPPQRMWRARFGTEDVRYGGDGIANEDLRNPNAMMAGLSAILFAAERVKSAPEDKREAQNTE